MREPEPGSRQQLPGELTGEPPAEAVDPPPNGERDAGPTLRTERRFRAMGTDCHVVVRTGGTPPGADVDDLADGAVARISALEALWSRFVPDSDTSRLNGAGGERVELDPLTVDLLARADEARRATQGWFDPFLGRALEDLGYDRTFDEIDRQAAATPLTAGAPAVRTAIGEPLRSPSPLRLDRATGTASLQPGVAFDPGGIGKGHAADVIASELLSAGATGALVNLGGDLRVVGANDRDSWRIDVRNPFDETLDPVLEVGLLDSGLATSSPLGRRWRTADGRAAHHILDPRNGAPATIELAAITVVAPTAATAEMLTTTVALAGPVHGAALLSRHAARAWAVTLDGRVAPV